MKPLALRAIADRRNRALLAIAAAGILAVSPAATNAVASGSPPRAPVPGLGHAGRWVTDAGGRVVIVHGINLVYKRPPYDPAATGFGDDDARFLSRIGFNAVRVGVIWKALEPAPGVFDDAYLARIARTVGTLARHGILSLLDFHQDLLNERFQGEGFPDWAIQDGGLPNPRLGFPINYEGNPALQHAFDAFWANAPGPGAIGLEDRYAVAWRHVAARFAGDPSVLGYELLNEPFPGTPFATCVAAAGCPAFDNKLTAFDRRVAKAIRTVDRRHLIFSEPNVLFDFGAVTDVGQLRVGPAGFAFHDYCFQISPTGCASEPRAFANALGHVKLTHEALLLTEFGSNPFARDLAGMVKRADLDMVPWLEWSYCPCGDPTGATPDPLLFDPARPPRGANLGSLALSTLVEPYPELIAGTPRSWSFNRAAHDFRLRYTTSRVDGRGSFGPGSVTVVAIPRLLYGHGYGVSVHGGAIVSPRGGPLLEVSPCRGARTVAVTVRPRGASTASCVA
ncbi:MAG: cellulase family glycosylhydrolase [Actinomycetota bacterium]|nr:cellulase family glycosylhydrolase [Actinomycetota bacterium]